MTIQQSYNNFLKKTIENFSSPPSSSPPSSSSDNNCNNILSNPEPPVQPNEAKDACIEMQKIQADKEVKEAIEKTKQKMTSDITSMHPFGFLNSMVNNLTSAKSEVAQNVLNTIKTTITTENRKELSIKCDNAVESVQQNIITDTTECTNLMSNTLKLCDKGSSQSANDYSKCVQNIMSAFQTKDVTMENILDAKQSCSINTLISDMTQNSNDTIIQAITSALQEATAKGGNVNASTAQLNCNSINTNISTKNFNKTMNCCIAKVANDQKNILNKCASVSAVKMFNKNNPIQDCIIGTGLASYTENKNTTKVDNKMKGTNKATVDNALIIGGSTSVSGLCSSFLILIASIVISIIIMYNTKGGKIALAKASE
jgi:hypothetical protein